MKRILFFYSHFPPAFKAGGPVQSLSNLADLLSGSFQIDVICSARDLGESKILDGVVPDTWTVVRRDLNVFYIDKTGLSKIVREIVSRRPDVMYVNGMFLPLYSLLPLWLAINKHIPVLLSPRGMLQTGAMAAKSLKKRLFLQFLKTLGLMKNVTWHATDEQERKDIHQYFGTGADIRVVGNVPKPPMESNSPLDKRKGELRLVFLSLITRKKNLDLVLQVLKLIKQPVVLDIFGPVKDKGYWDDCLSLISNQSHSIRYLGPVNPQHVQQTIKKYHALILLTKGENFGHAIYEALSTGTPALISQHTPWGQLYTRNAGLTVDINVIDDCKDGIESFISYDQEEFDKLSHGAYNLAKDYYSKWNFKKLYSDMFLDAMDRRGRRGMRNLQTSVADSEFKKDTNLCK